jgi:hypothetical protein
MPATQRRKAGAADQPCSTREGVRNAHIAESTNNPTPARALAERVYSRFAIREVRSHRGLRMFIAALALAIREARQNPERTNEDCRRAGIRAKRIEVRLCRLVIGRRNPLRQDRVHRWASAASYVSMPLNGETPPHTWRKAIRYIERRGVSIDNLARLYTGRGLLTDQGYWWARTADDCGNDWRTPKRIFDALDCRFDLDPASPGADHCHVPADCHYTEGGLEKPWHGTVWLNPPWQRGVTVKWVARFVEHRNGVLLCPSDTATKWFQSVAAASDAVLLLNHKLAFVGPGGETGRQFPRGTALVAIGVAGTEALYRAHNAGLGTLMQPVRAPTAVPIAIPEAAD